MPSVKRGVSEGAVGSSCARPPAQPSNPLPALGIPTHHPSALPPKQAYTVMLATLLTLLPLENADGADVEVDERLLRELAASKELDAKLGSGGSAEDAHGAALKLAWGVLLSQYGPDISAGARAWVGGVGAGRE